MATSERPGGGVSSEKRALSEEQQQAMRRAVPDTMLATPYLSWLGLRFERYEPDDVLMRLGFRKELTNDGTYYHGGVVVAAMDTAGAAAAWSNHDFNKGVRASTVGMSVQYVGAAKQSDLLCHGSVVRRGKELTFTEITATDSDGAVVAHGLQTYRIV
ncbi:MAG TPA: PaaI family thioesterase [Acidimicrobiales bacterium]|nr:PaaI family thioesterase [Acidimicrobiales bacterium]